MESRDLARGFLAALGLWAVSVLDDYLWGPPSPKCEVKYARNATVFMHCGVKKYVCTMI